MGKHVHHFHGRGGQALGPVADSKAKGIRRRRTGTLEVRCPTCGMSPGQVCVSMGARGVPAGEPVNAHTTRTRLATRVDNQRREEEGTLTPQEPAPKRRQGRSRPWTDEEDKAVTGRSGKALAVLAEELDRTIHDVRTRSEQLAARTQPEES